MITTSPIGYEEATESLTGYEENDVEARFGSTPDVLLETHPIKGMRALAYVLTLRDLKAGDVKAPEGKAYEHVMSMTLKDVAAFWPDEVGDPIPDEPVTPTGEGDSSAD